MGRVRTIAVMGATGEVLIFFLFSTAYLPSGGQGRGVIEALLFTKDSMQNEYDVRPMTRSLTSKLAQDFKLDFPQLSLVQWREHDADSIRQCFDGCYGAFISTVPSPSPEASIQELTRAEISLGERCLEAAKVRLPLPAFLEIKRLIITIGSQAIPSDLPNLPLHFQCK
jgi:hypothetical protein